MLDEDVSDPIHAGDTPTLEWDLDPAPPADAVVTVTIGKPGTTPIVERAGVLTGARLAITLTEVETDVAGLYYVSSRSVKDGVVHTYPTFGFDQLLIQQRLAGD